MSNYFDDPNSSFFTNPGAYLLFHQSAPPGPSPMDTLGMQDWNYFQTNIAPIQQQLFKTAMDPATYTNAANQAKTIVSQQYAQMPGQIARTAAGLGMTITPEQQAVMNRDSQFNQSLATASAANGARAATSEQMHGLMGM
jgi:hypothetical protein